MAINLLLLAAFVAVMLLLSFNHGKKQKKIIILGDSITAEASQPPGFISRLKKYLASEGLAEKFEVIGAGIPGNKIYDLHLRLDRDVILANAATAVIYIGTNDIWHKISTGTGTDADKFEEFYETIIHRLKAAKIEVVICTPAVIGEKTDFSNQLDAELLQYSDLIRNIAATNDLKLVDLRRAFLNYNNEHNLDNQSSGVLTNDGVHLNEQGNKLVAEEIWKVVFDTRP
ncbi:G-D-S-L family lipolytic protein [Segetibacter sp. 3557_3]|uniref:SGNH/GDSL hydrolase family protein n=1 Tax=Segetibacter sp. 3557_3 TaxID=2547429 RepID=UPI001058F9CB|nr:GDSL-type esterase/lipase family protein [Segetibacter sp. 3557_3]TDH27801.1 G-D-S-L family lipolytic protein [Segetibacter sp. 3557_3]